MKKTCVFVLLAFFTITLSLNAFAVNQLMALHGKAAENGTDIASGNIRVYVYDAASGGNLVYDSGFDFNDSIVNGLFDLMLGSGSVELDLNYGSYYFLDIAVNENDLNFGASDRKQFEASRGAIKSSSLLDANLVYYTQDDANTIFYKQSDANSFFYKQSDANAVFYKRGDVDSLFYRQSDVNSIFWKKTEPLTSDLNVSGKTNLLDLNVGGQANIFDLNVGNELSANTILGNDSYVRIGNVSTSNRGLADANDLLVTGDLEIDGQVFFDGTSVTFYYAPTFTNNAKIIASKYLFLGDNINTAPSIGTSVGHTPDALSMYLDTSSRNFIISERGDEAMDMAHAQSDNPTLFIHSSDATDTSQWLSFAHNQSDGVIDVGKGNLALDSDVSVAGDLNIDGNLFLPNGELTLKNGTSVKVRNAADTDDIVLFHTNSNNDLFLGYYGNKFSSIQTGINTSFFIGSGRLLSSGGADLSIYPGNSIVDKRVTFYNAGGAEITADELTSSTIDDYGLKITQALNDSSVAGGSDVYRALYTNVTETDTTGWNDVYLFDLLTDGVSKFNVADSGDVNISRDLNVGNDLDVVGEIHAQAYYSGNSQGITDGSSYSVCTDPHPTNGKCDAWCVLDIKDGLITGCT